jgi:ArsR family metal-binding transcriptional regulator
MEINLKKRRTRLNQEISVFDIYEYLPHTNCKNCGENNCMAFAEKLLKGAKTINGCSAIREAIYEKNRMELQVLLGEKSEQS